MIARWIFTKKMKAQQSGLIPALLLLFATTLPTGAHEGHPAIPTTGASVYGDELLLSDGAGEAIGLTTAKVTLADMPTYVRANGTIRTPWKQQAYVTTLMPGLVDDVLVRSGDRLQRGQLLARLSSLKLERIQLDLLQADSDHVYLSELYGRQKQLSETGSISGRKVLETAQILEDAASRLQVAVTKLKVLGFSDDTLKKLRETGTPVTQIEIRSPIQGTLVHADIRAGQTVDPEDHLFQIVDNARVWCVADVLETDLASVKIAQPVTVDVSALGTQELSGRVDHIDISVNPQQRSARVVIELDNSDLRLRPGMSARIAVQVAKSEQAIVCPRESLFGFGDDRFVLLERSAGKFVRRQVETGRVGRDRVEVLSGVFPGDQVTATGTHLLGSLFHAPQADDTKDRPGARVSRSAPGDASYNVAASGVVELPATSKYFASSRISGRIARIFVEHSQPVRQGDPLAEIESMELFDLQLQLFQSNLQRRWTERTVARLGALSQRGGTPRSDVRRLTNELRKLRQQVAMLKRQLVVFGLDEASLTRLLAADVTGADLTSLVSRSVTVRAPHHGLIAHFDLAPGRRVGAHDHQLFEIHDPTGMGIKAYLFEGQAASVANGQRVQVRFAADPSQQRDGRVVRIAPTSSERQRVFPVWIELDPPTATLREGMLTRVMIQAHAAAGVAANLTRLRALPDNAGE